MTIGQRISTKRKENNLTQEQLADILSISRQAVSRWETGLAFPETNYLIKMSVLFKCKVDYLLKGSAYTIEEVKEVKIEEEPKKAKKERSYAFSTSNEYKSKRTLFGIPLVHINMGYKSKATGIIAIGYYSKGIISIGVLSLGILSLGVLSLGLFSLAVLSLGLLFSAGAISLGITSYGAISVGIFSVGAISVGLFSVGALSVGHYISIGFNAYGTIAIGLNKAVGTYKYSVIDFDIDEVIKLLDGIIPPVLNIFKHIIRFFM